MVACGGSSEEPTAASQVKIPTASRPLYPSSVPREPLVDGHGRRIGDLRVSVTDRCNFRCQYCMPAEGLPWLERAELLTYEEIERLVRAAGRRWACTTCA